MLYEIKGTNVRIVGAIHMFPPGSPPIPNWLCKEYDDCDIFVTEMHGPDIVPLTTTPESNGVKQMVEPSVWQDLVALWGSESALEHCKPWWIHICLSVKLRPPSDAGVEVQLAQRGEKEHYCLESAKEFADALDTVPPAEYIWQFATTLQHRAEAPARFLRLYEAWAGGDLREMDRLTSEFPFSMTPLLRKAAFEDRNRRWLSVIKRLYKERRRVLVVVGALHLCGDGSIVQLASESEHSLIPLS